MQTDPDEQLHIQHFLVTIPHMSSKKLAEKLNLNRKNDFSILHANTCSLQSNVDNMQILIDGTDFQFDVLAVTET